MTMYDNHVSKKNNLPNRWLKASGVSIACEEKMRTIARGMVGENLRGEMALFSFSLVSGGDSAPLIYIPDLTQRVIKMLEDNYR